MKTAHELWTPTSDDGIDFAAWAEHLRWLASPECRAETQRAARELHARQRTRDAAIRRFHTEVRPDGVMVS